MDRRQLLRHGGGSAAVDTASASAPKLMRSRRWCDTT
jgi:hypothetical protein